MPRLGSTPLVELTTRKVSLFRTALLQARRRTRDDPTSASAPAGDVSLRRRARRDPGHPGPRGAQAPPGAGKTVHPLTPAEVEAIRRHFVDHRHVFSWALVGVMAYAGPRPGEALALEEHHIRERTILIEQAVRDGVTKVQKTGRANRSVDLIPLLRENLDTYREIVGSLPPAGCLPPGAASGSARTTGRTGAIVASGRPCRRRPPADGPYDLRHSFASLLIREQRYAITEIAEQMGHAATMSLNTYGHVFSEYRGSPLTPASQLIHQARDTVNSDFCPPPP